MTIVLPSLFLPGSPLRPSLPCTPGVPAGPGTAIVGCGGGTFTTVGLSHALTAVIVAIANISFV